MPRNKKAARRGNSHATSRRGQGQGQETDSDFIQFDGASGPKTRGHNGFTLQEEARNTERHHPFWDTDQRLRHTKVNFVSAGSLEPTIPKDTESAMAEMTLDSPQNNEENAEPDVEDDEETKTHTWTPQLQPKSPKQAWTFSDSFPNAQADLVLQGERSKASNQDRAVSSRPQLLSSLVESSTQDPTYAGFFVDTHGTTPVNTGLSPPRLRSTSPTPSNSSEEVILFGGRDRQGRGLSRAPKRSRATTDPIDAKIRIVEDKIHGNEELLEHVLRIDDRATTKDPKDSSTEFGSSNLRSHCGRHNHKTREEEEAALIADYIANIDSDIGGTFKSFNQRELGGAEDEIWQETEESSGDPVKSIDRPFQAGWSRASICDFDDLSTSDGVMGDVQAIISKRDRETGVQYLVVWENQTVDEARWVPVTTLISVNALLLIEKFEAEQKLVAEFLDSDEEDTSDSDVIGILGESDDEDVEEEEDLIQRKISHMSNEKIARLLAKQEELGMGSAEITLFDGDAIEDEDEIQLSKHTFSPVMLPFRKTRAKGWSAKRPRGEFPAAGLLADAYDGFDVMDFDRPSLKRKPKGRKGKLGFDLSDSEPEASMQMAWDNDRIKKKERRQEREGLRAQGLLGSKNSKLDLKQKYREGMGIDAVKEEIKSFLMGNNTTLSLPPMDKADRKVVHELAAAFNLKSKSAGSGPKRFPILYRTARTSVYVERTFDAVQAKLSRRYLPRMDVGGKRSGAGSSRVGKGGGFNNAAVSYRDGDIVGGSAPELGIENRGRAMLEKMGWSSGTALGALNNKGILEPVSHVVKTTKAGLG